MTDAIQKKWSRSASILYLCLSYLVAGAVAFGVGYAFRDLNPLYTAAIADLAGTVVIFLFSLAFNNSSFYDPYWSVTPAVIGLYFIMVAIPDVPDLRQIFVMAALLFWGIRLTHNFLRGWPGIHHEDWRYVDFRKSTGKLYWLVSFSGIHLFPSILVFLGCLSLYPALQNGTSSFGALDLLATIVTFGAVVIELISDNQLKNFRNRPNKKPGEVMNSGLWAYSRHPNYFGEVSFWWGLFLFAMASDATAWYTASGPVLMTILFVFISIPMLDKRMLEKRPNYIKQMKQVSALIPWLPKKSKGTATK